jgi:hypothetical protein
MGNHHTTQILKICKIVDTTGNAAVATASVVGQRASGK